MRDPDQERITRLESLLEQLHQLDLGADLKRRIETELERLRVERKVLHRHLAGPKKRSGS